jgi:hypothetical protein
MARDASGNYTLPSSNPVVTLTTIASAWANGTFSDVASELTNSLDRNGRGGMLAALKVYVGSSAAPGLSWDSETNSGLYRIGSGSFGLSVAATRVGGYDSSGWNQTDGAASPSYYRVGFREIPQNSQSAAYGLLIGDAGKHIYHPSADTTARVWTIPANASVAFPIGTAITFVNDTSAGTLTIAITSDTLVLMGVGSTGSRTLAANGIATALKVTSTRWVISGTNLT